MAQTKAYQPLIGAIEDSKNDYIEFERGFDRILTDNILKESKDICRDLLYTESGAIFDIYGVTERSLLNKVKSIGRDLVDGVENLFGDGDNSGIGDIGQYICVEVNEAIKVTFRLIETMISFPILLIEKLTSILDKLNNALNELTLIFTGCLLDKINQIKNFINNLVPRTGNLDSLSTAIDSCPQLYCFIVDKFRPLCNDSDFSDTQGLLECLRSKITVPINSFFNEYIIDIMKNLVDEFLSVVESTHLYLVKKIRNSIKQYIKALYKKYPIPDSIRWLLSDRNNCSGPSEASIMDIIYALRQFSTCIDSVCGAVSSTLKRDIQDLNERLHLGFSYWNKFGVGYDLFLMFERGESISSSSINVRKDTVLTSKVSSDNSALTRSMVELSKQDMNISTTPTATAIIAHSKSAGANKLISEGTILPNGDIEFRRGVEDTLVKIYKNMSSEPFLYKSKFNEFSEWDSKYNKTKLNSEKMKIIEKLKSDDIGELPSLHSIYLSSGTEQPMRYDATDPQEISSKNNDYKPLYNTPAPLRDDNESDLDYYSRWYNEVS